VTRRADSRQVTFLSPDQATLLHLVRENLRLLADLASTAEVALLDATRGGRQIRGPGDVAAYLGPELASLAQEQLRVVCLDTRNRVLATPLVYQGGLNATVIRLADVFREAVRLGAAAIVLVHNHPSGDPTPSPEDVRLTGEAGRAGDLLGIDVLDHVVVAGADHLSLRETGQYTPGGSDQGPPLGPSALLPSTAPGQAAMKRGSAHVQPEDSRATHPVALSRRPRSRGADDPPGRRGPGDLPGQPGAEGR
jgi:DNA repair protein RadC